MAKSSGPLAGAAPIESFQKAAFKDPSSSARYAIERRPDGYDLSFARDAGDVSGKRLLQWFVGSGSVGRSYLFSTEGFLFQAPVSWYSRTAHWDTSPGYKRSTLDLTRAIESGCLQCHASRPQPLAGTVNGFAAPPFLEGGVSCERCHGPGQLHIQRVSTKPPKLASLQIVNPRKLDPEARDSVCAQCHLTGAARIARFAKSREMYQPGDRLSSSLAVFVRTGPGSGVTATSHFERLQQSACKIASGDRLWCGSCHDPHEQPASSEAPAWYRTRCQTCHPTKSGCTETMAVRQQAADNCVGCHMPSSQSPGLDHVAFTDHSIPRRPQAPAPPKGETPVLTSFWTGSDERDEALAYSVIAMTEPAVRARAFRSLQKAAAQNPKDVAVLAQLAQFYDRTGAEDKAMEICEQVLQLDPSQTAAAVNLGTYYVKRGKTREAIDLWQGALKRNPGLSTARVNMAVAQFQNGQVAEAGQSLRKALEFDPDLDVAHRMLNQITARQ